MVEKIVAEGLGGYVPVECPEIMSLDEAKTAANYHMMSDTMRARIPDNFEWFQWLIKDISDRR
jgi:hypothetical protein